MRQENNTQKIEPKKKERIAVWLYPSTLEDIDRVRAVVNCKSRSEFLGNAARFYAGYISGKEAVAYLLPAALVAALWSTSKAVRTVSPGSSSNWRWNWI